MQTHRGGGRAILIAVVWASSLLFGQFCYADFWGSPSPEHWSDNRQFVLKVSWPKENKISLAKVFSDGTQKTLWTRGYVDESYPPHEAFVSDDGRHVVFRDVYSRLGYGQVLVFLGAKGEVIRSYSLGDLLTEERILACGHSVSSIWWSEPGWFSLFDGDSKFAFVTCWGEMQCFDVSTGDRIKLDEALRGRIRGIAVEETLQKLRSDGNSGKIAATEMCGALQATEAIPELKKMLGDRKVPKCNTLWDSFGHALTGPFAYNEAQVAAARALIVLLGVHAVALIEEQFDNSSLTTRGDFLKAIAAMDGGLMEYKKTPDSGYLLNTWRRLERSRHEDVREYAVKALVVREQAEYVLDRPELLQSDDAEVRHLAVESLADRGDAKATSLLRKAFYEGDSLCRVLALRGLVRLRPNDIDDILRQGIKSDDAFIYYDALEELVRRGDQEATGILMKRVASLKDHTHDREAWGNEELFASALCRTICERKLYEAEPALRQAYASKCENIRRSVCGALAALGDRNAFEELRESVHRGNFLERSLSIEMLGAVGNTEALNDVHAALHDEDKLVRDMAREAAEMLALKDKERQASCEDAPLCEKKRLFGGRLRSGVGRCFCARKNGRR